MSSEHTLLIERVAAALAQPQAVAAEAQGMLCGLICTLGGNVSPRGWRDQVLEGHQGVAPAQEQVLQSLFEMTLKEFFSEDLSFQPLLPGDGDEEQESAYAELVEYVRMGALLVYDELADVRRRAAAQTH